MQVIACRGYAALFIDWLVKICTDCLLALPTFYYLHNFSVKRARTECITSIKLFFV